MRSLPFRLLSAAVAFAFLSTSTVALAQTQTRTKEQDLVQLLAELMSQAAENGITFWSSDALTPLTSETILAGKAELNVIAKSAAGIFQISLPKSKSSRIMKFNALEIDGSVLKVAHSVNVLVPGADEENAPQELISRIQNANSRLAGKVQNPNALHLAGSLKSVMGTILQALGIIIAVGGTVVNGLVTLGNGLFNSFAPASNLKYTLTMEAVVLGAGAAFWYIGYLVKNYSLTAVEN